MKTKTYFVRSMDEAVQQIKEDLGPEAAIVHTRTLPATVWNALSGRKIEVVASVDLDVPDRFEQWSGEESFLQNPRESDRKENVESQFSFHDREKDEVQEFEEKREPAKKTITRRSDQVSSKVAPSSPVASSSLASFDSSKSSHSQVKTVSSDKQVENSFSPCWDPVSYWIAQLTTDSVAAKKLTEDLVRWQARQENDSEKFVKCPDWNTLAHLLGRKLSIGPSIDDLVGKNGRASANAAPVKVALVGPTGVGKTTTVAKLAGQYSKHHGLSVGLITVDTFRVGAIDQLKTYSQIMNLPLEVVSSEREVQAATDRLAHCDLILIDTVGRSPRDAGRIESLRATLAAVGVDHLLMTLSCSSSCQSLNKSLDAFSHFRSLAPSSLVMTKVDEVESLAGLWPFFASCGWAWSYWTNGQNVPEDIGQAQANAAVWFLDKITLQQEQTV